MKNNNKTNKGFTIIEVLIVLAIGAAIMLVVFLAVPALNRNSKNNTYKQEAQRILAGASEYSGNNDGLVPGCVPAVAGGCRGASDSTVASSEAETIFKNANPKNITKLTIRAAGTTTSVTPTFTEATMTYGVKCGSVSGAGNITYSLTTANASARSATLIYAIESSSGAATAQCIDG